VRDIPAAPDRQAAIVSGQPLGPTARRARVSSTTVRLGLRDNLAQFSLLV